MKTARDLGRVEPWQESLERSLARRGKLTHPSIGAEPRPDRNQKQSSTRPRSAEPRSRARPAKQRGQAKRRRRLIVAGGCATSIAVAAGALPSLFGGHSGATASTGSRVAALRLPPAQLSVDLGQTRALVPAPPGKRTPRCGGAAPASGYANPLAAAQVTSERIDQGVDYAGAGTLTALGHGRITYVGTSGTGWPGAFIEYRLLDGPDRGCLVYYAEGVQPKHGLHVGQSVRPGEPVATIISGWPSGIELGWGGGHATQTYAMKNHGWTQRDDAGNVPTPAGLDFSALISSLGGKPGKVEGERRSG